MCIGIYSVTCRTRVESNINGEETCIGRGNLSFATINLPYLALEAKGDINKFYKLLDKYLELTAKGLLERYELQKNMKVKNFPFLMGQHLYIDSDNLLPEDTVEKALKHGTLSIGFIGLAETLICLTGKHHGESEESDKIGYEIISHMRKFTDDMTNKYKLNFSVLGTPAETYCMRARDAIVKRFGIIKDISDREYLTNSSHVPVWYPISFKKKMDIEGKYHKLENAGHIAYVEVSGDISNNLTAFESILRAMSDADVGYGAINLGLIECTVCGCSWVGSSEDHICPKCKRDDREPVEL